MDLCVCVCARVCIPVYIIPVLYNMYIYTHTYAMFYYKYLSFISKSLQIMAIVKF